MIGAVAFSLFADGSDAVGLPAPTRDGGTLEHVVVAFLLCVACGTARIKLGGTVVKRFSGRQELEAAFEVEQSEAVSSSKGFGEGLPMDRLDGIVSPAESLMEISFEKS